MPVVSIGVRGLAGLSANAAEVVARETDSSLDVAGVVIRAANFSYPEVQWLKLFGHLLVEAQWG